MTLTSLAGFRAAEAVSKMQHKELARMTKGCGAASGARVGLQVLVLTGLHQSMGKSNDVRSSKWAATMLASRQKMCAVLDAIKPIEVRSKLLPAPDLTERLSSQEATDGASTNIVAPHGAALEGKLRGLPQQRGGKQTKQTKCKSKRQAQSSLIEVTKVFAPSLVTPGHRAEQGGEKRNVMLQGFATSSPFRAELPLAMLKQHDPPTDKLQECSSTSMTGCDPSNSSAEWKHGEEPGLMSMRV